MSEGGRRPISYRSLDKQAKEPWAISYRVYDKIYSMDTSTWIVISIIAIGIVIAFGKSLLSALSQNKKSSRKVSYEKKPLLTGAELNFLDIMKELERYVIIVPQVNLASVVQKNGEYKWQTELYRNIDFGIFDKDYNLLLLIELNDSSHSNPSRQSRDIRVKEICEQAGIDLMTFYTNKPNEKSYVLHRISEKIRVQTG